MKATTLFEAKRAPVRLALADAEAEHAREALAVESGKKSTTKLDDLRAEIAGHRQRLVDLDAAERAARRRAEENAARDLEQERREARDQAEDALARRERAATAMQRAIAQLAEAHEAFEAATDDVRAACGELDSQPVFRNSEDLPLMLAYEFCRVGLFSLARNQISGVDQATDLATVVRQRNAFARRIIDRAQPADLPPPAA